MIPKGLFSQLIIIALSVGIIVTYVRPQFEYIADTQNLIVTYQAEREKVVSVNSQLSALVTQMENISTDDRRRLLTYLPDQIDSIAVQRDIRQIIDQSGAVYRGVAYGGVTANQSPSRRSGAIVTEQSKTEAHTFTTTVEGTYAQLKNLLTLLERNNYPLEIQSAGFAALEGGFLSLELTIVTYSLRNQQSNADSL